MILCFFFLPFVFFVLVLDRSISLRRGVVSIARARVGGFPHARLLGRVQRSRLVPLRLPPHQRLPTLRETVSVIV